jgi:hypothetical protein
VELFLVLFRLVRLPVVVVVLLVPAALPVFFWVFEFASLFVVVLLLVVLSGTGVAVVGDVRSVGLPAVAGGCSDGTVVSPAVGGTDVVGLSTGGVAVGEVELVDEPVVVVVELPVVEPGAVEGVVCCAITPLANIAETASVTSRTDFRVELVMEYLARGKCPWYWDGTPSGMGTRC